MMKRFVLAALLVMASALPAFAQTQEEDRYSRSIGNWYADWAPRIAPGQEFNEDFDPPKGYGLPYETTEESRRKEAEWIKRTGGGLEHTEKASLWGAQYHFDTMSHNDVPTKEIYPRFFHWDPTGKPADLIGAHIGRDADTMLRDEYESTGHPGKYRGHRRREGFVIMVNEGSWVDGVAGMSLDGRIDADGLLMNTSDKLSETNRLYLEKLKAEVGNYPNVVLIGGEQVLEQGLADELRSLGIKVNRYAGESRVETMIEVNKRKLRSYQERRYMDPLYGTIPSPDKGVNIARGYSSSENPSGAYADLVTASFYMYNLVTPSNAMHPANAAFMKEYTDLGKCEYIYYKIYGGPVAVGPEIEDWLSANACGETKGIRVAGETRYETNLRNFDPKFDVLNEYGFFGQAWGAQEVFIADGSRPDMWQTIAAIRANYDESTDDVIYVQGETIPEPTKKVLHGLRDPRYRVGFNHSRTIMCYASEKVCREALDLMVSNKVHIPGGDFLENLDFDPHRPPIN